MIIVQANQSDRDAGRLTLSERVVATHLQDDRYATQLIERLTWAAIDAERLQSPSDGEQADEHPRSAAGSATGRHGLKSPAHTGAGTRRERT